MTLKPLVLHLFSLGRQQITLLFSGTLRKKALTHTPSALEERQTLWIGEVCHLYLSDEIQYTHSIQFSIQFVVYFILIRDGRPENTKH